MSWHETRTWRCIDFSVDCMHEQRSLTMDAIGQMLTPTYVEAAFGRDGMDRPIRSIHQKTVSSSWIVRSL